MKKFIATLLSALVGVFGYTLTDSVVEDRISKLETEIVELRKEVSANNQLNGNIGSLEIGDYIGIHPTSLDKLLLRENENGELEFIHPSRIDQVKEDDVFVYITDLTCQVIDFKTVTHIIEKGKNYEPDSVDLRLPVVSVSCKGYTSTTLSGKQITVSLGLGPMISSAPLYLLENSKTTGFVSSDGSFGFNAEYSSDEIIINFESVINTLYHSYGKEYIETFLHDEIFALYYESFNAYNVTIL